MAENEGKGTFHGKGSGYSPKIGDLFLEDYNGVDWASHIGIVRTDAANGSFSSVEGNSSNSVASNTRNVSDYCYVTPPFNGSSVGAAPLAPQREIVIELPGGLGKTYTYETWNREEHGYSAWKSGSAQKKLITVSKQRNEYSFDGEGYGFVGKRYVVAMTSTFGDIGDYVDIYCADGRVINAVIGDEKSQTHEDWDNNPANKWGHENGQIVVEFLTNWSANPLHENPSSNGGVLKVINLGNYFNYPEYAIGFDGTGGVADSNSGKSITSIQTMSYIGASVDFRENPLNSKKMLNQNNIELYISGAEGVIYKPVVVDEITWETEAYGSPAQLEFTIIKDAYISFEEGDQVIFKYKGAPVFYGFIFQKQRTKQHHIKVTAYDQTRYFKNSDCFVFEGCTATEIVKSICNDYKIAYGQLEDTGIKLPLTVCDNVQVFQIIENALDYTVAQGGYRFLLWDNFGSLVLAPKFWYKKNYVVCDFTAQDFDYTTTINEGTYTRVKLYYDNDQTGTREVYIRDKSAEYPKFGVLQYCSTLDEGEDGVKKAEEIIKITTNKIRKLDIKGALGDVTVRGGTQVYVELNLGDIIQKKWMECFSAKHTFKNGEHFMDLHLVGGQFI